MRPQRLALLRQPSPSLLSFAASQSLFAVGNKGKEWRERERERERERGREENAEEKEIAWLREWSEQGVIVQSGNDWSERERERESEIMACVSGERERERKRLLFRVKRVKDRR